MLRNPIIFVIFHGGGGGGTGLRDFPGGGGGGGFGPMYPPSVSVHVLNMVGFFEKLLSI